MFLVNISCSSFHLRTCRISPAVACFFCFLFFACLLSPFVVFCRSFFHSRYFPVSLDSSYPSLLFPSPLDHALPCPIVPRACLRSSIRSTHLSIPSIVIKFPARLFRACWSCSEIHQLRRCPARSLKWALHTPRGKRMRSWHTSSLR